MNIQLRERTEAAAPLTTKTAIADCDIHPARATRCPERWVRERAQATPPAPTLRGAVSGLPPAAR